jgi:DNA-binding Lrp family transcriptional regulator
MIDSTDMSDPQLPDKSEPTDDQLQILKWLREDPWMLQEELAGKLGVTSDAAGHRIRALRENDWLDTKHVVNLAALGYRLRYRIDVKTNPFILQQSLEKLKSSLSVADQNPQKILAGYIKNKLAAEDRFKERVVVEEITITMGDPADLCVTVRVRDHDDILDFVTAGLRATPGVENTSSCLEAWSVFGGKLSEGREKGRRYPRPAGIREKT